MNKIEELKPKPPIDTDTERQLLPRLKFMGFLLFVFSLCAFLYAVLEEMDLVDETANPIPQEMSLLPDPLPYETSEIATLSSYLIGISFACVGAACLLAAWRKEKQKFSE